MGCELVLERRTLVDPEKAVSAHTDLAGTPHSAPLARIFLREHLPRNMHADVVHTAELLTTELVTNVVLHVRTSMHLGVTFDDKNLLVTVQDADPAGPQERHQIGIDHLEESGRGMTLIASLADDFGWSRLPRAVGKVMWFALALPPVVPEQSG